MDNSGTDQKLRSVMDIPATLLFLYDIAVPEEFDGEVMSGEVKSEIAEALPIRFHPGDPILSAYPANIYSPEETDTLYEHLKALGYVTDINIKIVR